MSTITPACVAAVVGGSAIAGAGVNVGGCGEVPLRMKRGGSAGLVAVSVGRARELAIE